MEQAIDLRIGVIYDHAMVNLILETGRHTLTMERIPREFVLEAIQELRARAQEQGLRVSHTHPVRTFASG